MVTRVAFKVLNQYIKLPFRSTEFDTADNKRASHVLACLTNFHRWKIWQRTFVVINKKGPGILFDT